MDRTNAFALRAWYAAGWSHEIDRKPLARSILGRKLVLFRDGEGRAHALEATCPHRGADLARGRVVDGALQCPFHGWRFDGTGRCIHVPSQPEHFKIPPGARTRSFAVNESQQILWLWMDESEPDRAPPRYDFLEPGSGFRRLRDRPRLAAAPFVVVVENGIDNSHPPHIHPNSLPGEPDLVERQLIEFDSDMQGFSGWFDPDSPWTSRPKRHQGLADVFRPFPRLSERDLEKSYFRFDLGGAAYFYDSFSSGHAHVGLAFATPADETHTWFFAELVRNYWLNPVVDAVVKWWMAWLNREDVLECEKLLVAGTPGGLPNPVSVVADGPALAFRHVYAAAVRREGGDQVGSLGSAPTNGEWKTGVEYVERA